jgi:hypothetical protein
MRRAHVQRVFALMVAATFIMARPSEAQQLATTSVAYRATPMTGAAAGPVELPDTVQTRNGARFAAALTGTAIGGSLGALAVLPHTALGSDGGSDDVGGGIAVFAGGVVGAVLGAAIGSMVFPVASRHCSRGERFARGLRGAALGLTGVVTGPLAVVVVPITIPLGAVLMQRKC